MFRLLSKQINIFSIPAYLILLLFFIGAFNSVNLNFISLISSGVAFVGIAIGYFLFRPVGLTRHSHLSLFLYTVLIFSFYFGEISPKLALIILGFHLLILTILKSRSEGHEQNASLMVGFIMGMMYLIMPGCWPLLGVILLHFTVTSNNISGNFIKLLFGLLLVFLTYLGIAYISDFSDPFFRLIPWVSFNIPASQFLPLLVLIPIVLFLLYAVIDSFVNYNKKSPESRFRYNLLIIYFLGGLVMVTLYMERDYEYLLLLALPLSVIISRGLQYIENTSVRESTIWVLVLTALAFKIGYYFY